jgi:hypothetical protein
VRARIAAAGALGVLTLSFSTPADAGPFGIGLVLGRPTGVSAAYEMSDNTALAFGVGLNLFDGRHGYLQGDFLFYLPDLVSGGSITLYPYVGPGIFISDVGGRGSDRFGLGARVPFGLALDFAKAPIQLFLEVSANLLLVPDVNGDIAGAFGFRYYF